MKRVPLKRKRATSRRTTSPRCVVQRCGKRATHDQWCLTHATRKADTMFSLWARKDMPWCAKCGATERLQWAHVHSRRYKAIRWHRHNYVILDARCHAYFTHHPLEWEQWCRTEGVPWDWLRECALNNPPMDPVEVIRSLGG